jgi:hypothetical protein
MSYSYIGDPDIGYYSENNPFLSMIAAVEEEPQPGGSAGIK